MLFGQAITGLLRQYDVDTAFGIPGVHTVELYRGLAESGIRGVVPRHEQGAAFMADGYARATGKPGVCFLISGPGVLNAMTPIAQAWHDSTPLLVVASTVATGEIGQHRGALHDTPDQSGLLAPLTSASETVPDPDRFAEAAAEAFQSWATGRPRPVHIGVPVDCLGKDVGSIAKAGPAAGPAAEPSGIPAAVGLLRAAVAPVLVVGGGARNAASEVQMLAERLDAPVVLTGNARGLLPERHFLAAGTSLPFPETQRLVAEADVVVAVGTELGESEILYTGSELRLGGTTIRIDIDPAQTARDPACAQVVADAAVACRLLVEGLGGFTPAATGAARAAAARAGLRREAAASPMRPWVDALAHATPDDAVVALDSAQLAYQAHHFMPWSSPNSWMAPYGFGTLGPALPMAVGAAVGRPDRPVLAVAGDAGVLFTIGELATAVDLGRQLTLVIWDNAGYGEIRASFDRAGVPRYGTDTTANDLRQICEGFGADASRVSAPEQLEAAVRAGSRRAGVSVVVVDAPFDT